jgi:hypothetical protein
MNTTVRNYLIELARKKKTCFYQQLSDDCKLGLIMNDSEYARAEIGKILGEIVRFEHANSRPLLSSLVISKGDNYQGDGFYKIAEELGFGSWKKLKGDVSFEIGQMNACYDFWSSDVNYMQFK